MKVKGERCPVPWAPYQVHCFDKNDKCSHCGGTRK